MEHRFFEVWKSKKMGDGDPYEVELARAGSPLASRSRMGGGTTSAPKPPAEPEGQLTVDVYETAENIVIESAVAGVRAEDIDISVTTDTVVIRGSRHHDMLDEEHHYLFQECYWGRFTRSIILPEEVDPENADVTFKNGVLSVRLPKANRKKMRKLQVRAI